MLGKHYLVQEQDPSTLTPIGQARQYTVASTMEPTLYSMLVNGLTDKSDSMKEDIQA